MKTLTKILGVGGLLAALGSGCDRTVEQKLGKCEIDVQSVEVIYHQKSGYDSYTLEFGGNGAINVQVVDNKIKFGWFRCLDGRELRFGNESENTNEPTFAYPQGGN